MLGVQLLNAHWVGNKQASPQGILDQNIAGTWANIGHQSTSTREQIHQDQTKTTKAVVLVCFVNQKQTTLPKYTTFSINHSCNLEKLFTHLLAKCKRHTQLKLLSSYSMYILLFIHWLCYFDIWTVKLSCLTASGLTPIAVMRSTLGAWKGQKHICEAYPHTIKCSVESKVAV